MRHPTTVLLGPSIDKRAKQDIPFIVAKRCDKEGKPCSFIDGGTVITDPVAIKPRRAWDSNGDPVPEEVTKVTQWYTCTVCKRDFDVTRVAEEAPKPKVEDPPTDVSISSPVAQ
jgi:hypothetical protein